MSVPRELPAGMWIYSFMFGDKLPFLPDYIAAGRVPVPSSLLIGIGMGVGFTAIRLLLDFAVFKPLARRILGVSSSKGGEGDRVPLLDAMCAKSTRLSPEQVEAAMRSTRLSREQVQSYARSAQERAAQARQVGKFKEAAWRLVVYSGLVCYGLRVAYGQAWFNDPYLVWEGWPMANYGEELEMYYHVSMGVYWHFTVFQFYDTRRSDFYQMLVHHVATLFLLTFSWLVSLVRIGTLVMLVHDVSDIFMETAKLFNYAQRRYPWCHLFADGFFFVFAAVFGVSRLYVYPRYMVLNVWTTESLSTVCRLFFCGLLSTLQVLHAFWFTLILRMVYMFVFHGVEEDIRSDNDEVTVTSPESAKGHVANGKPHASTNGTAKAKTS